MFCCALSGLQEGFWGDFRYPGRCPGLICCALSGQKNYYRNTIINLQCHPNLVLNQIQYQTIFLIGSGLAVLHRGRRTGEQGGGGGVDGADVEVGLGEGDFDVVFFEGGGN